MQSEKVNSLSFLYFQYNFLELSLYKAVVVQNTQILMFNVMCL